MTIQATGLKNHILFKHPVEYNEYKCDLCQFVSVNPTRLTNHKNNHKIGLIKNDVEESDEKSTNMNSTVDVSFQEFPTQITSNLNKFHFSIQWTASYQ